MTDNQEDSVPAETDLIKVAVQNLNDSPEFVEEDEIFFEFEEINTVTGDSVGDITSLGTDEDVDDIYLWRWAVPRMVRMKIGRYM